MVLRGEWGDYEKARLNEYSEMLKIASKVVWSKEPPWRYHEYGCGRKPSNDPRAVVLCLLLKIWLKKSYRDTVSFIDASEDLWDIIGLRKAPRRMDLQRAMNRLDRNYLENLNRKIVAYNKKGIRALVL
jgi:hypothetical protein